MPCNSRWQNYLESIGKAFDFPVFKPNRSDISKIGSSRALVARASLMRFRNVARRTNQLLKLRALVARRVSEELW